MFPEKRPDRVYGLCEDRLEDIVVKADGLGATRATKLRRLQEYERVDFASAVPHVFTETDGDQKPIHPSTIKDVDLALARARCERNEKFAWEMGFDLCAGRKAYFTNSGRHSKGWVRESKG